MLLQWDLHYICWTTLKCPSRVGLQAIAGVFRRFITLETQASL